MLIISQIIGIVAVGLYLLSYQLKKGKHIALVTAVSNALYVLQYILLGAFSGALMDFLSATSSFLAAKKSTPKLKPYAKYIAIVNLIMITVAGLAIVFVQKDYIELIPIIGAVLQTGGLWFENEQTMRKFGLMGAPFWLAYNFISQAYAAAFGSFLAICSVSIAIMRYRKKKDGQEG